MTANSNTLMKKTKAQLVEIILKNDEVVLNMKKDMDGTLKTLDDLRDKNKKLNDKLVSANNEIKDLTEDYDAQVELCEQFKEEIDNNTTLLAEYENEVNKLKSEKCNKKAIRCWQTATIAAIVLAIIFAIV